MSEFDDFVYDPEVWGGHDPSSLELSDEEWDAMGESLETVTRDEGGGEIKGGGEVGVSEEWYKGNDTWKEKGKEKRKMQTKEILEGVLAMENIDEILMIVRAGCLRYSEVDARTNAVRNHLDLLACQAESELPGTRKKMEDWAKEK